MTNDYRHQNSCDIPKCPTWNILELVWRLFHSHGRGRNTSCHMHNTSLLHAQNLPDHCVDVKVTLDLKLHLLPSTAVNNLDLKLIFPFLFFYFRYNFKPSLYDCFVVYLLSLLLHTISSLVLVKRKTTNKHVFLSLKSLCKNEHFSGWHIIIF